jgi:serine/threonine protein phosphatase PrpC
LGVQELETVRADSISDKWRPGQKILLCSDGLTDCVRNNDIESILKQGGSDQQITDNLIEAVLEGGGNDNITVVVVSAPEAVKHADSDTHVPDSMSRDDTTHVPDDIETQDTERNRTSRNQSLKVADG